VASIPHQANVNGSESDIVPVIAPLVELDPLTKPKLFQPACFQGRPMKLDFFRLSIFHDEAVAFTGQEPADIARCHDAALSTPRPAR
jgi:hypothetical protein